MKLDPQLNSCTLADAQREEVSVSSLFRLSGSTLILGQVRTAVCEPHDILGALEALDLAQAGEVLVFGSASPSDRHCFIGDNMVLAAITRGVVGMVIDGYARDVTGIQELGFSLHARGRDMSVSTMNGDFDLEAPVIIDGVTFRTGDYIAADSDGIARIPANQLDATLASAQATLLKEAVVRDEIRAGRSIREAHQTVADQFASN